MKKKGDYQPCFHWRLDDDTTVTAQEVADFANITVAGARYRLNQHTDPKRIWMKNHYTPEAKAVRRERDEKRWTLDDGTIVTASSVAIKAMITRAAALQRLQRLTNPERVYARNRQRQFAEDIEKELNNRDKKRIVVWGIPLYEKKEDSPRHKSTQMMYGRDAWIESKGGDGFLHNRWDNNS